MTISARRPPFPETLIALRGGCPPLGYCEQAPQGVDWAPRSAKMSDVDWKAHAARLTASTKAGCTLAPSCPLTPSHAQPSAEDEVAAQVLGATCHGCAAARSPIEEAIVLAGGAIARAACSAR